MKIRAFIARAALAASFLLAVHTPALAATRTWDGSASGNWSNPANWVGGVAPTAGDSLSFPVTATRFVTTNNFPAGTIFSGITIQGSNYVFRGSSLVLQDDLRALSQGGPVTFDLGITIDSPLAQTQFESRYGAILRFNNTLHLAQAGRPLQFINGVIRVAGAITGPGRIEAIGGDLYFDGSAANTFTGSLELSIGNLYLNKTTPNAAIPPGCIVERGGTPGWVRWLRDDQISSTAVLRHLFLDLNNQSELLNDFHTSCVLSNGTLTLSYNIVGSSSYLSGDGNGRIQLAGGNHFIIATNTATVRNEITGSGHLFVSGGAWTWLENSNSFTADLTVFDGVLVVRDPHALGSTNAPTTVYPGATLMLRNNTRVVGESLAISGTGHFQTNFAEALPYGFGALHAVSPSNAWTGPITLDGPTTISAQGEGAGAFRTNAILLLSGAISGTGTLTKEGLGTMFLGGNTPNTFGPITTVRQGTLKLDKTSGPAIAPANLFIGGADPADLPRVEILRGGQIPDTAAVTVYPGGVLDLNNQSEIIQHLHVADGTVDTGTGALVVSGNLYGTDAPELPTSSRIIGNGRLLLGPAAHNLFLSGDPANDYALEIACELGGSGALEISGDGSLHLAHSNSFTGPLTMAAHKLGISAPSALGGANAGTIVHSNSTLALYAVQVPAEPLTLHGGATLLSAVALPADWGGSVHFPESNTPANAQGASMNPGTELNLSGVLSGPGTLRINGGQVMFSGSEDNTLSGEVRVEAGTLLLSKTNATAIAHRLRLGHFSVVTPAQETVRHLLPNQLADGARVYLNRTTVWDLGGFNETIGSLGGGTNSEVRLGQAHLTVNQTDDSVQLYSGIISGSGRFTRTGNGYMLITGDNTYAGPTDIQSGQLEIWGIQPQSHVTVAPGGTLTGFGTVGHVNAAPGAIVAPGYLFWEPVLTTSNLHLQADSRFRLELFGPGTNQVARVRGQVTLAAPLLELDWRYIPSPGDTFRIIDNDGNDPVNGTFAGLPGGAFTAPNGLQLEVTYGNDVTLRVLSPGQATLAPGLGLTVTGGNGNGAIEPNECNQLHVTIANTGTNNLPPFKVVLVSDGPEATVTQPASDYPAIPANASAVNLTPFQLSTSGQLVCGTNIPARLLILTTNGSAFALDLPLPTGLPATPESYHAEPNAPVLDGILTESTITVPAFGGHLAGIEVSLFIEHASVSDLQLTLVAPDGTEVRLAEDLGAGANYGSACAPAARTRFTDQAGDSITSASAPYVGTFRPQNPLSVLRGLPGSTVAGSWKLRVNDHVHFNTGVLRCWSLTLAPAVCTDGGGACTPCPGPIAGSIEAGAPEATSHLSVFAFPGNCFSNSASPTIVKAPAAYQAHAFTNLSSQPTCVSIVYTPLCEENPLYNLNVVGYLDAFNPADSAENFLASAGAPNSADLPRKFSFQVPPHRRFEIVITATGKPSCAKYQLEVLSPDLCPVPLTITGLEADRLRLDWPTHASGYQLQHSPSLQPAAWSQVMSQPIVTDGRFTVTNTAAGSGGIYRLLKP